MDPKLIVTGELIDKSNAYGFVVVLLELLTRKKPPYPAKHSLRNFEEGNLCEILDEKIVSEKTAVWLEAVAYDAREECEHLLHIKLVEAELAQHGLQEERMLGSRVGEMARWNLGMEAVLEENEGRRRNNGYRSLASDSNSLIEAWFQRLLVGGLL
ncbi:hypothetical protein Ancab_008444 [Ancistrocladus abbreviatus]